MNKPLFDNVGRDLKEYARGIYFYNVVGYIMAALGVIVVSFVAASEIPVVGILGFVIGVGIAVIGHANAKLSVMKLYAYGELVERVADIEYSLTNKKNPKCGSKNSTNQSFAPKPVGPSVDLPITERNNDGTWDCIFCDSRNSEDAVKCRKCGAFAKFK